MKLSLLLLFVAAFPSTVSQDPTCVRHLLRSQKLKMSGPEEPKSPRERTVKSKIESLEEGVRRARKLLN